MAAPTDNQTLEHALGGLPLVLQQGLNTNNAVNFSGFQVSTGGNASVPTSGAFSGNSTGPTASMNMLNITAVAVTGPTGASALTGLIGALDGGPATVAQNGWATIYVGGVKCWVPIWV